MKQRILSVDVIRGLTIVLMVIVNTPGSWSHVYAPLLHAKWHGCTPTDLVFPFFIFISGVSIGISLSKNTGKSNAELIQKIWKRAALIFLVGLLLNWFPFYHQHISDLRIFGVLQRIALAYGIGATMIIYLKDKALWITSVLILIGYYLVMLWGGGDDPFSLENNFANKIDLALVGENHVYGGFGIPFDPEGLLHSFPAAITFVLGYIYTKLFLSHKNFIPPLIAGAVLVILGQAWNYLGFPINKPLWTSSYVLYTGGLGYLFLTLLRWIIDEQGWKKWTLPFQAFGMNPLASYVLSILLVKLMFRIKIGEENLYGFLYAHVFQPVLGDKPGSLAFALSYGFVIWLFAYYLFRKKIVIKL